MWLLSQWGNTDQVVQWAKAGVVKSSSEKNSTSLGGTKYPCVGYGHKLSSLFRCELLCEAPLCFYANVKDDSESPPWPLSIKDKKKQKTILWLFLRLFRVTADLILNVTQEHFSNCQVHVFQHNAGRFHDPAWAGVRQPAGMCLQDGVHQLTGPQVWGENPEEATTQV